MKKKIRQERKGINENWRQSSEEKDQNCTVVLNDLETQENEILRENKNVGDSSQSYNKKTNYYGTNNRGNMKRNHKHEDKKSEIEKGSRQSGNGGVHNVK